MDLCQVVLEGVAHSICEGGAKSKIWAQIITSVLNMPISFYKGKEAVPAFGAARLAQLAIIDDGVNEVCPVPGVDEILDPDPGFVKKYQENSERFRRLYQSLRTEFQYQSGEYQ